MAILGKANITIAQVRDGEPRPMYFQWSKSERIFAPKDSNFWIKGSAFIFSGGSLLGNIPYQSGWISDWSEVADAKSEKYRHLWCKLTTTSEPFLFTGYTGQKAFTLTSDRATYIINRRLGMMSTLVTLTVGGGSYNPDSLTWTLNGEAFTPTQSETDSSVYLFTIPYTTTVTTYTVSVVPYIDGLAIDGVSASLTLTAKDETDYYSFIGSVTSLPTSGDYINGDSCFYSTENAIYVYDGSAWVAYDSATLSDAEKVTILAKAQKTAFEWAEDNGLSQDYAYISTLITKYVYARAIGTELLQLQDSGKIIGGSQETDTDGYLKALGVYIDSTGLARFTNAKLNDCDIKGGNIDVLEISGELHNDVLWTNTRNEAGEAQTIGSVGSQLYYKGSEAKTKIKGLLASENTVYSYSGQYAGVSFAKLFKGSSKPSIGYFNDNVISLGQVAGGWSKSVVFGENCVIRFSTSAHTLTYEMSRDMVNWQTYSMPYTTEGTLAPCWAYCYGQFHLVNTQRNTYYVSSDGITWVEKSHSLNLGENHYAWLTIVKTSSTAEKLYLFDNDIANDVWKLYEISTVSTNLVLSASTASVSYYGSTLNSFSTASGGNEGTFRQLVMIGNLVGIASKYIHYYRSGTLTYKTANVPENCITGSIRCCDTLFVCLTRDSSGTISLYSSFAAYYMVGQPQDLSWSLTYTFPVKCSMTNYTDNYLKIGTCGVDNVFVSIYDGSVCHLYMTSADSMDDVKEIATYPYIATNRDIYPVGASKLALTDRNGLSATPPHYLITISKKSWQKGLNFLNSNLQPVAYESQLTDAVTDATVSISDGTTSLLNLPTTIPSDMNTYRRIPTLFDASAIYRSIQSVAVPAYTIFDPSLNAERTISAVTSGIKVSVSPDSFKVDDVEKANSTWYIKNATVIAITFTPYAVAAGVETGSMNPKEGLKNVTLGAIRPYKAVRAEQIQGDKFEGVYPIGAVYISSSATDPTTFFGGTWQTVTSSLSLGGITLYMFKRTG